MGLIEICRRVFNGPFIRAYTYFRFSYCNARQAFGSFGLIPRFPMKKSINYIIGWRCGWDKKKNPREISTAIMRDKIYGFGQKTVCFSGINYCRIFHTPAAYIHQITTVRHRLRLGLSSKCPVRSAIHKRNLTISVDDKLKLLQDAYNMSNRSYYYRRDYIIVANVPYRLKCPGPNKVNTV